MTTSEFVDYTGIKDAILMTPEMLEECLDRFVALNNMPLSPETIPEKVIKRIMHLDDIKHTRNGDVVKARQIVMWYFIKYENYSLSTSGRLFNLDHNTARHACGVIENLIIPPVDKTYHPIVKEFLKDFGKVI